MKMTTDTIEITERMCIAALEAYWGKRSSYQPYKRQLWTDKEIEGMYDAIKAALATSANGDRRAD